MLAPGEIIPIEVLRVLSAQIGIEAGALAGDASREETRHNHLVQLRDLYGFKTFAGRGAVELRQWRLDQAFHGTSNFDLAERFIARCREAQIILPGGSTIERLCAEILVAAERQIDAAIADRLYDRTRQRLDVLLDNMATDQLTRFVWLRQFDVGNTSRAANQLLDRLERLQKLELSVDILAADPIAHVTGGWGRFRRYAPRMLRVLQIEAARIYAPLVSSEGLFVGSL